MILFAASLPSHIAVTTRSEPLTISPPENIFGLDVWNFSSCFSGAKTNPLLLILMLNSSNQLAGLALKPKATTTSSAGYIFSLPGIGTGTLLPF